jgi:hypothetical protein
MAGCAYARPAAQGNRVKQFFFEKKNQKTFAICARASGQGAEVKVFCFFFSKKKAFFPLPSFTRLLWPEATRILASTFQHARVLDLIIDSWHKGPQIGIATA